MVLLQPPLLYTKAVKSGENHLSCGTGTVIFMLLHSRPLVSAKLPSSTSLIVTQPLPNLHGAIQNQKPWLKLPTSPVQHVQSARGFSNAPREAFSPAGSWQPPACDKLVQTLLDHTSFEAMGCEGMSSEEVTLHSEVSLLSCLDTGCLQKAAQSSIVSLLQDAKRPLLRFSGKELLKKGRNSFTCCVS